MTTAQCDCGYENRQATRDAAWATRVRDPGYPWPPTPNHHLATCVALKEYPLRQISYALTCEKCGESEIKTTFHKAHWHYQPHRSDYWRQDLYAWSCLLTHGYRPVEHLDRTCATCGWKWLETTAEQA